MDRTEDLLRGPAASPLPMAASVRVDRIDQTHDAGPAVGSRHGGKLSTSPHSVPLTGYRQVYVRRPCTPGVQSHGDQPTRVLRGRSGWPAGQCSGGISTTARPLRV
jgi:hypothetical protein